MPPIPKSKAQKKVENLTPSKAAELLGCSVQHLRLLIRRELEETGTGIKATSVPSEDNQHGYRWMVPMSEVERYNSLPKHGSRWGKRKRKVG